MNLSAISWTDRTWNFIHGCSKVSDGCKFCYAEFLSLKRGWTHEKWTIPNEGINVLMKPHKLGEPYTLKVPQRVFVNSMSDMFHRQIPDWYKAAGFCVMLDTPQHIYQILTKRPDDTIDWHIRFTAALQSEQFREFAEIVKDKRVKAALMRGIAGDFPTCWGDNIWQGASVESRATIYRIDELKQNGAKVRFISAEPLLDSWGQDVDLSGIHWVIVGGESGLHLKEEKHESRWMNMEWAIEIKNLCLDQGVAFFFKQDSALVTETRPYLVESDGSKWVWHQFPGDLRPPHWLDENPVTPPDNFDLSLRLARENERLAYIYMEVHPELARKPLLDCIALTAAYYYQKARELRGLPQPLTDRNLLSQNRSESDPAPAAPQQLTLF